MSAVTTGGKPGHKVAVQLTFPEVYASLYADERVPQKFAPESSAHAKPFQHGSDIQAEWHEIQRNEANRRALNGVKDTQTARNRYVVSPSGYFNLPKEVLSQRKFANPSYGASGAYSARNDLNMGAPFQNPIGRGGGMDLEGGVMRTVKGRDWASERLRDRIAQLDAIDQAGDDFQALAISDRITSPTEPLEPASLVDFNISRQTIIDALSTGGLTRLDLGTVSNIVSGLFRLGPVADQSDLEDIIKGFEVIMELISGYEEEQMSRGTEYTQVQPFIETRLSFLSGIEQIMDKSHKYAERMYKHVNDSPEERQAISRNAIRSLGFTKLLTSLRRFGYRGETGKPESERRVKRYVIAPNRENMSEEFTVPSQSASNQQADGATSQFSRNVRDNWATRTSRGFFGEESMARMGPELRNPAQPRALTNEIFPVSDESDVPPGPRAPPGRPALPPKPTGPKPPPKGATIAEMPSATRLANLSEARLKELFGPAKKKEGEGRAKKSTSLKGLIRRLKNRR